MRAPVGHARLRCSPARLLEQLRSQCERANATDMNDPDGLCLRWHELGQNRAVIEIVSKFPLARVELELSAAADPSAPSAPSEPSAPSDPCVDTQAALTELHWRIDHSLAVPLTSSPEFSGRVLVYATIGIVCWLAAPMHNLGAGLFFIAAAMATGWERWASYSRAHRIRAARKGLELLVDCMAKHAHVTSADPFR